MTFLSKQTRPEVNILRAAHAELFVSDLAQAREFYVDLLRIHRDRK